MPWKSEKLEWVKVSEFGASPVSMAKVCGGYLYKAEYDKRASLCYVPNLTEWTDAIRQVLIASKALGHSPVFQAKTP